MLLKDLYLQPKLSGRDRMRCELSHRFIETPWSELLEGCSYAEYITMYDQVTYSDEDIEELHKAIKHLTKKQQYIVNRLLEGKMQVEIAEELGVTQSCVSATLLGNTLGHGGILKRLRDIMVGLECKKCGQLFKTTKRRKICDECRSK